MGIILHSAFSDFSTVFSTVLQEIYLTDLFTKEVRIHAGQRLDLTFCAVYLHKCHWKKKNPCFCLWHSKSQPFLTQLGVLTNLLHS